MKNILITGSNGFIGQNLCAYLEFLDGVKIIRCNKDNFVKVLETNIKDIDFIFHLAGTNRSNYENDYLENNVNNTEFLTNFLQKANNKAPIIFASSVQVNNFSIYSQTKKKAEDILIKHSKKINLKFQFLDYLMFLGSGLNQIITHLYLPLLIML